MPHWKHEIEAGIKNGVIVCGVDEVGRGPLAGPVVACAVCLPVDMPRKVTRRLKDSKQIEREEREGRLRAGVDQEEAADFVARVLLSLIGSPARWDLSDPAEVRILVREEILAGVLTPQALAG